VLEAVRCPVVMGLSAANQRTALERQQALQKRSIAGLLAAPPAYIKPSQDGLIAYFRALADAANVPLLLYNIPYRTGVGIALASYLKLAEHPRIVATKDCGGDPLLTMKLIADGRIAVLAGEDAQLLSSLALGASGAILASAHIRTDFFASLFEQVRRGDLEAARRTFYRLLPLMELLFAEPNPGPLKSALAMMGWMEEVLREPMLPASPALREKLGAELRRLECL
jgi:4-hydroxy-tetrahydrodipicolinate synthase